MEHVNWGIPVALDLFLAGMGAGAFMLAVMAQIAGDRRHRAVSITGALIAPWPAIMGIVLLVADLGKPLRFWELLLRKGEGALMFNLGSTMSIGTWLMTIFIMSSLAYLAVTLLTIPFRWGATARKVVGIAGLPFALLVTVYTGVLLAASPKVLWNTPLLPVLFAVSAIATGIACVVLVLAGFQIIRGRAKEDSPIPKLERLYSGVIACQILVIIGFVLSQIRFAQMRSILGSGYGLLWWIGVIGLGLLLPLVVGFGGGKKKPMIASLAMAASVLLGGFLLRYVILMAGQTVA